MANETNVAASEKTFSKEKWLEAANAQKARGTLSQREINDALEIWVNDCDGKTMSELSDENGKCSVNEAWFV